MFPYILVSVFRYDVGVDYLHVYGSIFSKTVNGLSAEQIDIEPGFWLVNKIAALLFGDPFLVFATMAIVFHVFIYMYIMENSDNIPLSMFLLLFTGLFTFSLNGIRQAASIAICMWATRFAKSPGLKQFVQYAALVLLASTFHHTAYLYIPIFFLLRHKFSLMGAIVAAVAIAAVYLSGNVIEVVIKTFFSVDYASYYGGEFDKGGYWSIVFEWMIVFSCFAYSQASILKNESSGSLLCQLNLIYIGTAFALLSSLIPNAERVVLMFTPAVMVLVPSLVRYNEWYFGTVLAIAITAVFSVKFIYDTCYGANDGSGTLVYQSLLLY